MPSRIVFEVEDAAMDNAVDNTEEVETVKVSRVNLVSANVASCAAQSPPRSGGASMFNNMWLNALALNFG